MNPAGAVPLTSPELQALTGLLEGEEPILLARSQTRVDVGLWFRRRPLGVALSPSRFALAAEGPRPFRRVLPASGLASSTFNHVTGEVVLGPADDAPLPALRLDVETARRLVQLLRSGE